MTHIGFHVWNPAGRLPTYVHDTFLRAWSEKDRLQAANPDQRFVVMAPVLSIESAQAARAFSDGKAEGYAEARDEVMAAEGRLDKALEELAAFKALRPFIEDAEAYQSIVADCLLWIQGFNAAYAGRESYERPDTPSVDKLRDLNIALQFILRERDKVARHGAFDLARDDLEIPF